MKRYERIVRAAAQREFTVKLVPFNGGETITVKKVVAYAHNLAMQEAERTNPGYISTSSRVTKVLV